MKIQQFDNSINLLSALLWRHNNATHLETILTGLQALIDRINVSFWNDWYTDVFNLDTANDFGLAVWAIILDLPLELFPEPDDSDKPVFGFASEDMTDNENENFNQGNFGNGSGSIFLETEEKRLILKLRYFKLISRAAVPETNKFLKYLFEAFGPIYVLDGLNMSIRLISTFNLDTRIILLLQRLDLIPRASGVGLTYILTDQPVFGFASEDATDNDNDNFDNGNFGYIGTII